MTLLKNTINTKNFTRIKQSSLLALVFSCLSIFAYGMERDLSYSSYQCLNALLDDMKLYTFVDGYERNQAGELFQHSMWVHYAANDFVITESPYSKGIALTDREKMLFSLAALLHDVGKAGREDLFDKTHPTLSYNVIRDSTDKLEEILFKFDNEEHCKVGFEYLAGKYLNDKAAKSFNKRNYSMSNGLNFDFDELFKELGINSDERKLIAILVGIHYSFGTVKQKKLSFEEFLAKLQQFIDVVNYNDGKLDCKLLQLSILIQVADVKGLFPCHAHATCIIDSAIEIKPVRIETVNLFNIKCTLENPPFKQFGYALDGDGKSDALGLMREFESYYKSQLCDEQ